MTIEQDKAARSTLEQKRAVLERWIAQKMAEVEEVQVAAIKATGGHSHEILELDVRWQADGRAHDREIMIRFDPVAYRKRSASNLRREFDLLRVMAARRDVPVPEAYWFEDDTSFMGAAFYAMRKVPGRAVLDTPPYQREGWLHDLSAIDRRQVWRSAVTTMARFHAAPAEPFAVLRYSSGSGSDFDRHFDHWRRQYTWAMDGQRHEAAEAGWAWLQDNLPENRPVGLAWGDARYVNFLFDGLTCSAMLDWEDVSFSSPLFDLGRWFLTQRLHDAWELPALEGLGDRAETIALWEATSGLSAADLRWYELFNAAAAVGIAARTAALRGREPGGRAGPAKFTTAVFDEIIRKLIESKSA